MDNIEETFGAFYGDHYILVLDIDSLMKWIYLHYQAENPRFDHRPTPLDFFKQNVDLI